MPRVILDWAAVVAIIGGVIAFTVTREQARSNTARLERMEVRVEAISDGLATKQDVARIEARLDQLYQLQTRGNR